MNDCYEIGKQAYLDGKKREPLKDQNMLQRVQNDRSARYHPNSPMVDLPTGRRAMVEQMMLDWKEGWDDAHKEDLEE